MFSSEEGVTAGDGECNSIWETEKYGVLCGSGEMSIESFIAPPGEEETNGGVVMYSRGHPVSVTSN